MVVVEKDRKCCCRCLYWHGCLVIAKNETGFSCSSCVCKFYEPNDKPTFESKLKSNNWAIPNIIHLP